MNLPEFKNTWTTGNLAQLIALAMTIAGVGIAIGTFSARMDHVERSVVQADADSRTLIEVRSDVAYIKQAVQNLTRDLSQSAALPCPPDSPVYVASYCRANPDTRILDAGWSATSSRD